MDESKKKTYYAMPDYREEDFETLSEIDIAREFALSLEGGFAYSYSSKQWWIKEENGWNPDRENIIFRMAVEFVENIGSVISPEHCLRIESLEMCLNIIEIAKSDRRLEYK